MNKNGIDKIVNGDMSKSKKMVELYVGGLEIKEIAILLEVSYNFVYNRVSDYCRINDVELRVKRQTGESKKDKILELLKEGKTKAEVCKELKVNYNYVFKVEKAAGL